MRRFGVEGLGFQDSEVRVLMFELFGFKGARVYGFSVY